MFKIGGNYTLQKYILVSVNLLENFYQKQSASLEI